MKAEIISIGTEILLGDILDTNSNYIAQRLPALGIDLYFTHQIGDNLARLADLLRLAWERSDLVLCSGGLGPTEDDITRDAICAILGEEPEVDPDLEAELRAFFSRRGAAMPERNLKQAWLTPSTRAIPNPRGTAPGWWAEKDGRIIIAMPGPPAEMARMWEKEVAPQLERRATESIIVSRTVKTAGLGEGTVDEMVSSLLKSTNPSIGVYAKADGIHLRITAKAPTRAQAEAMIEPMQEAMERILGGVIWGYDDDTFEIAVGRMLKERGLRIATMESATGGLLASTLTDAPGSSAYMVGGMVAYATEQKIAWGVPREVVEEHGVISIECARAMARVAREQTGADIGIGITGVAGPDTQEDNPVGTMHIALDDGLSGDGTSYTFAQSRDAIKRRAVTSAMQLLRRSLLARG
ncbi:MAG: competence/damage-inducible protein A [Dehalococcoidia bacterium]